MSDQITRETKLGILRGKQQFYRNTFFAHGVDVRVGKEIDAPEMVKSATENMRTAQRCIDLLGKMIKELEVQDD